MRPAEGRVRLLDRRDCRPRRLDTGRREGGSASRTRKADGADAAEAARPAPVIREDEERILQLYVERFNRRDWEALRSLIAADATLRVADWFEGRLRESPYFTRYAGLPMPMIAALNDVDGQPAIVRRPETATGAEPHAFVRIVATAAVSPMTRTTRTAPG